VQQDADGRDVRDELTDQRNPGGVEVHVGYTDPEIEVRSSLVGRVVEVRSVLREDAANNGKVSPKFAAPATHVRPSSAAAVLRRPWDRRLSVTTLQARGVGGRDDLDDAEHDAESRHPLFGGHKRSPLSVAPGTIRRPETGFYRTARPATLTEHRSGYLAAVSNPRNSSKLVMHRSPREVIIDFIGLVVATDDATGGEFS
jgi:hypothetical protein